jgi:eukaryotic-like serine/threonine-protein kinase
MDDKRKEADISYQKGQLIGHYKILDVLKQGRLADTFLGKNTHDRTPVVIKLFHPPLVQELQKDFLSQARVLTQLDHPHILKVRDMGVENHYPFLVSDYAPSATLRQKFARGNAHSLETFLPYLKQIASALEYAHHQGILHGDVRPKHILVDQNDHIFLTDFTVEVILQNQEQLNYQRIESIAYTAPERIRGKATASSDLYSLGIIVYELLCGEVPFAGSYIETANLHLNAAPPSLRRKVPGIPSSVEKVVLMALSKEPAQRFTSVHAFVNALDQAQDARAGAAARSKAASPYPTPSSVAGMRIVPPPATMVPPPPVPSAPSLPLAPARLSTPQQEPVVREASSPPIQPVLPITPEPGIKDSPLAPRRANTTSMTRRVFAVGLVGLAAAGGAGGWYLLSRRLAKSRPPLVTPDGTPPTTQTSVNNTNVLIFSGHLTGVNALYWSPDSKRIASASNDTFVQVFDASSGKRLLIYRGHTKEVVAVSWSPDGKRIASAGQDATVQIWDVGTGKQVFVYKGHKDRVDAVSWSSDSAQIASGGEDKTVQIWNASSGEMSFNFQGHTAGVLCVGWQPGDSSVASGSWDGTLRDWAIVQHGDHFNAGEQIFSYGGHGKNEVSALAWSPDGNFIASAGADQTVQLSNGTDGTPRPVFFTDHRNRQHVNPVLSVAWSPNGDFIASGDTDGNVYVWRVAGRKTVFTYRGHKGAVNAVAWSPDGKRIASASADATVHVWTPQ